jgi:protocatechuate 3,4-dioxygenase beta subunit
MRPLVVLILVLGALGALLFALVSLTGGERSGPSGEPIAAVATDDEQREPANLADPVLPETRAVTPVAEEVRQAVPGTAEARGASAGAILGKVVDEAGNPIAEAQVSLVNARPNAFGDALYAMRNQDPPRPVAKVVTDPTGIFRFDRLDPRKNWTLVITHERYMKEEPGPIPVPEDGVREEVITLKPGMTCSGMVRDALSAQPIPGALLVVENPMAALNPRRQAAGRIETKSDEAGRYTFFNVAPGQQTLTVSAPGYATQVHYNFSLVTIGEPAARFKNRQKEGGVESKEQDFELARGLIIAGRVIGPESQGMSGILIEAMSQSGTYGSRGIATSGKDGEFLLEGLAEGYYTVRVDAPGYQSAPLQRVEAGMTDLLITLLEQASVMGRVVDATGQGLVNFTCKVRAVNESSNAYGAVVATKAFTNAKNGQFEIPGVPEGDYIVEGIAAGYASSFSEPFTAVQGLVTSDVVVRMSKGGSLRGQVVDSYSGDPLPGAEIETKDNMWVEGDFFELFGELEPSALTKSRVRTDAQGRFEIAVMTPGDYQVQIKSRGYTPVYVNDVHVVDGQVTELPTQALSKGAVVQGVVHGLDGRVAAGAKVMLTPVDNNQLWSHRTSRADASGRYTIENAQPGTYKLAAARPDQNSGSPFDVVVDMRQSEIEITIDDGGQYEFDLFLSGARGTTRD